MERTDVRLHESHLMQAASVPGSPGTPRTDEKIHVFPAAASQAGVRPWVESNQLRKSG